MKKFFFGVLIVIVLLVAVSMFLPNGVDLHQSVTMVGNVDNAFAQVNNPSKWKNWSVWDQIDPAMRDSFAGAEEGAGAEHYWWSDHESVGNGHTVITESNPNKNINVDFFFMENSEPAVGVYSFEQNGDSLTLTSTFKANLPPILGPWIRMMMIGDIEEKSKKSLENIKNILESAPAAPSIEVTEVDAPEMWYMGITDTITMEELETIHGNLYGEIFGTVEGVQENMAGMPLAIWHVWDSQNNVAVVTCGVPVQDTSLEVSGRITYNMIEAGKALKTTHWGWYDKIPETHELLRIWMSDNNKTQNGASWEIYANDPNDVLPDTSKVETQIYIPI